MGDLLTVESRPPVEHVAALPPEWVNDAERAVLLVMACDSFDGQTTAPSFDSLIRWTGMYRSRVYQAVRDLTE